MKIGGNDFIVKETFDNTITIPDCFVLGKNKLGHGHGEAKLYFGSKENMRLFYGGEGFNVRCFILKSDLVSYLEALKDEYKKPSQNYTGKDLFRDLWRKRMKIVTDLDDVIYFSISDQTQIEGARGYVSSDDFGYKLIREISLPLVSYLSAMELVGKDGKSVFYWKLFVDFDAISEKKNGPLVFTYGKKSDKTAILKEEKESKNKKDIRYARIGQGRYRENLLEECPYCPITMVNDERLLIASHIKPWAASTDKEKIDPKNGFMLSPLYDKLFDKGFITFTDDKHMLISNWLSPKNCQRLNLKNNVYFQRLPIDEKRRAYLEYHRKFVFKG